MSSQFPGPVPPGVMPPVLDPSKKGIVRPPVTAPAKFSAPAPAPVGPVAGGNMGGDRNAHIFSPEKRRQRAMQKAMGGIGGAPTPAAPTVTPPMSGTEPLPVV